MMTTRLGSSLSNNRLPGRLDKVHSCTTPKEVVNDARVAAYAVLLSSSALLWVRELANVQKYSLTIGYGLGEILPPSPRIIDAAMVVMRKAPLHACSQDQNVRPSLVRMAQLATRVPDVAVDVPSVRREHEGCTCVREVLK